MKSKKILSILLIGLTSLSLIACSPSATNNSTSSTTIETDNSITNNFDFDGYYGTDETTKNIAKKLIGKKAANIKMKTINGKDFNLSSLKGQNTIIEIADTNCHECIKTIPEVIEYEKQYKDYQLVKIFSNNKQEDIRELYKSKGFELDESTVIAGGDNPSNHVDSDFNIEFVPTFIYVNKDGFISLVDIGGVNTETIKTHTDLAFKN